MTKWTLEHLLNTTPGDFENLVAHLFKQMGYGACVTQYSRDGGIDIEISLEHFGISHRWLVQVKRYVDAVGVKEVREYSSLRYRDNVDGVIIVTTSSFTKEAEKEAADHNVKLIGGALLVEMLNHYCPDGQTQTSPVGNVELPNKKKSAIEGAILKSGEDVIASESVVIGRERLAMVVTNKNIFFKKGVGGMLSNRSEISRRIGVNEIIGLHAKSKHIFLLIGSKEIDIIGIQPKNRDKVLELLEHLRADYLKGEHLLKFTRTGTQFLVLTNKRFAIINLRDGARDEIKVKNIIGSRVANGGLFKKAKLIVSESGGDVQKREFEVDDASAWQKAIKDAVRVS